MGVFPFERVQFCDFLSPGSVDHTGVTDRETKNFNKSKDRLSFTNRRTQNLIPPLDEDGGTEQSIVARKVGASQPRAYCAR